MALWFIPGAGQAAFLLQASLALFDAMDVIEGLKDMKKTCGDRVARPKSGPGKFASYFCTMQSGPGKGPQF